ncbi:MAG: mevalonate kinase [Elusimicrobia bacterium]|nr:mevalonate kinase [Elusimicrobiota bacterium]
MRCESAEAASKLILLGEHAVVYGEAALAVPLKDPRAQAKVCQAAPSQAVAVELTDYDIRWDGMSAPPPEAESFSRIIQAAVRRFPVVPTRGWKLSVRSEIPSGCGLGSGTAVTAAAFRAIFRYFRVPYTPQVLSELVYEIEKLHHGKPSGIDNTVIALGRPILFRKGTPARFLSAPRTRGFLVVGHTGKRHRTAEIVAEVARARGTNPARYDALFKDIGRLAGPGAEAFQAGRWSELGRLMDRNQELLISLGVSSPELDALVGAARSAGALGAKLSGAGRGGCMAALTDDPLCAKRAQRALKAAGAAATFLTEVSDHEED